MAPLRLTPDVHKTIVDTVKAGAFITGAANRAGVGLRTVHRWLAQGRVDLDEGRRRTIYAKLAAEVAQAEGEVEARVVLRLQQQAMAGDVKAASWFLSHRFPGTWGDRITVETGVDSHDFTSAVDELVGLIERRLSAGERLELPAVIEGDVVSR